MLYLCLRKIKVEPSKTIKIMAFDFKSVKNAPKDKTKKTTQIAQRESLREGIKKERKPALEKNDWGLLFYYYFLDEFVRSCHPDSIPPIIKSMIKDPEDLLASMERIAILYDKYCESYGEDIHRVLDIMREIAPKNGK
jgi:hypothetical protein